MGDEAVNQTELLLLLLVAVVARLGRRDVVCRPVASDAPRA